MLIGADYYPEHWDRADWGPHAKLMEEGGFKVVRLAEFAWSKMEPREGKYDFGWLDDAIGILRKHDIKIILGTPTAAPPPWLMTRHPDALVVDQDGIRTEPGGRRHYCYSNTAFREASRRIVTAMAAHYTGNPAIVGWQTDNEIGGPKCWCESCARAFRDWLKARHGSLENLNRNWGCVFWGQEYTDWSEIPVPRDKHAAHSPSIRLDHARFHSDLVLSYHDMQVDIIKKLCPGHFVTHNCMGFYNEVDYTELVKKLDRVALDFYPGVNWGEGKDASAAHDYTRSLKHAPWMVMEQRSGLTGWLEMFNPGDHPGQLRLWTYQTVAHGADAVVYFRWRTCRYGIEQYWHGVLDHHGQPGRRYRELSRVAKEFAALGDRIEGAAYNAPAGILINPEARWALEIQKGNKLFDFMGHAQGYHRAFAYHHAGVEYYTPQDDFSPAKVLVAPALFLCDSALAAKLEAYVRNGGALVLTFRSGVKDGHNVVVNDRLPGVLKPLAGCLVEEYDAPDGKDEWKTDLLSPLPKKTVRAGTWCDALRLDGAKAIARYATGPFKGAPAAALNRVGQGFVVYVGFQGDRDFNRTLVRWLLAQRDITLPFAASEDVEITERTRGKERFLFVLNHAAEPRKLSLPGKGGYRDLLTGQKMPRTPTLDPYEVRILAPVSGS